MATVGGTSFVLQQIHPQNVKNTSFTGIFWRLIPQSALVHARQHKNVKLHRRLCVYLQETLYFTLPLSAAGQWIPYAKLPREVTSQEKRGTGLHIRTFDKPVSLSSQSSPRVKRKITQTNEIETRKLSSALLLTLLLAVPALWFWLESSSVPSVPS